MGRRDSSDEKWARTKDRVRKRDKHKDRIFRCLSMKEALLLKKNAGKLVTRLDAAHIFPVSLYPELCYVDVNIVLLNRYSHSMLDDFRDPVTGGSISKEVVYEWWQRIAGEKQWKALMLMMNATPEEEVDGEAI